MPDTKRLLAHWPLTSDARDISGNGNDGGARGVRFAGGAAHFDGRLARIDAPDSESLKLGTGDFTISAWISTEEILDHVLGDILCKFDPVARRGVNFGLMNYAGCTSSQPNWRNLFFGIDDGKIDASWSDCGRPGNTVLIWTLCVFNGDLYAGTFESGLEESGRVWRYKGGDQWEDCGSPHPCNSVSSLVVFDGQLYASVAHYRSRGSSLAESENVIPGGRVYRYEGGSAWTDCGALPNAEAVFSLVTYRGQLYATSMYAPAGVYRYEGGTSWKYCGHPGGRIEAMAVHRGHLYGTGYDLDFGGVYRYTGGETWEDCGTPADTTQTYAFAFYGGEMYVGTWPSGRVYRYDGQMGWENTGQLGAELEVMGMAVYNGKMYAGTLPLAEVYRYDGDDAWTRLEQLDKTPDVKYRRAWSMAVYQGRLFCGTLPSGRVYAIEAGKAASYDHALQAGWRHVAAVRTGDRLLLYVDGAAVAESRPFERADYDLSNDKPLHIGFGMHDYFNGSMRDVRLYGNGLTADEVKQLHDGTL